MLRAMLLTGIAVLGLACRGNDAMSFPVERQITFGPHGHILTNIGVWSGDSKWVVYDVRSDVAGSVFDGDRIERVNVETGEVQTLYRAKNGAHCGVVTYHPSKEQVVFILGPENPTADWSYAANKRQGVIVDVAETAGSADLGRYTPLDARDLTPPFTPGALRGGTHVHVFSADGAMVSFTYNDAVLERLKEESGEQETDLRNVGVSMVGRPVKVPRTHRRNHDGSGYSVVLTRTTANPVPGSNEIKRAYEDAWISLREVPGRKGIVFLGDVVLKDGRTATELFLVEPPEGEIEAGDRPIEGTATRRPSPPRGVEQVRLTFTQARKYPGVAGPRFWPRPRPDGLVIAFLARDDDGVVQLFSIAPTGRDFRQVTHNRWPVASAFSWSPDGRRIAHVMDNSVFVTEVVTGESRRLTARTEDSMAPRAEACVFSPDGRKIAYVRTVEANGGRWNQVFVVEMR